jgi:hypothetical protein
MPKKIGSIRTRAAILGVLEATVTTILTTSNSLDSKHTRWVGALSGGIVGGERYKGGSAYYEQFALLDGLTE